MMLRLLNDVVLRKNLSLAGRHEVQQRFSAERMSKTRFESTAMSSINTNGVNPSHPFLIRRTIGT